MRLTLKLNFILDDQWLSLGVNSLGELCRDSVVGSLVLDDETLVANHAIEDMRLLNSPLSDVGPLFFTGGTLFLFFLCVRWLPSRVPVIRELFEEGGLQLGGLNLS